MEQLETLSLILLKIEKIEKKTDKMYIRLFESNGNRSICDMIKEHDEKLKKINIKYIATITGTLAGAIISLSGAFFIIKNLLK